MHVSGWAYRAGSRPFLFVQVSAEKKLMGSTAGMQTSVETSPLLRVRLVLGRVSGCLGHVL